MCDICKLVPASSGYVVKDAGKTLFSICPSCAAKIVNEGRFLEMFTSFSPSNTLKSEISGEDAVIIEDFRNSYTVTPKEAEALLGHKLNRLQYMKLIQNGHTNKEFLLHETIYSQFL